MWCVVHHIPIDLSSFIIQHMFDATDKNKGKMPYGMIITCIIQHLGLYLGGDRKIQMSPYDAYSHCTLFRLKFYQDNGIWKMPPAGTAEGHDENAEGALAHTNRSY